jgi:hypothetical protein
MIIGLCGLKNSGKDTVAAYLVKQHNFERKAFADPLKQSVAALFGIDFSEVDRLKNDPNVYIALTTVAIEDSYWERRQTFREFLQRYGTESHRDVFGRDFWLDHTLPVQGFYPGRAIIVTDVRFANEAERIRMLDGTIWMIDRPNVMPVDTHISEMMDFDYDFLLNNDGSLEDLYENVEELLSATAIAQTNS